MTAPELKYVATMRAQLGGQSFTIDAPLGRRYIVEVGQVTLEGDRISAKSVGKSAADWLQVSADGEWGALDVRLALETDDGVLIYVEYGGRTEFASGRPIAVPTFHCGDDRYDWLNRTQFVAVGAIDRTTSILSYELYEVVVAADA